MTKQLWEIDALLAAVRGRHVKGTAASRAITGISIDTRTLTPGDVFFAIRGEYADGHNYVQQAWDKGAAAVVVETKTASPLGPEILVDSTFDALKNLGCAARKRGKKAKIVAITGSVGKTTTKNMVYRLLARFGQTWASIGNQNNHYGVPLNLARMPEDTEFGVFELGISEPGEMAALSRSVLPDIAVITGIAPAHAEYFTSNSAIAKEKSQILVGLQQGGAFIYPYDSPYRKVFLQAAASLSPSSRLIGFGRHSESTIRLLQRVPLPSKGGRFSELYIQMVGRHIHYRLSLPGLAMAKMSLAALAVLDILDLPLDEATSFFATLSSFEGRGVWHHLRKERGMVTLIDDAYNASPASMVESLRLLLAQRSEFPGKAVVVLGDMLELGDQTDAYHKALAAPLMDQNIDQILLCGRHMKHLYDALSGRQGVNHYEDSHAVLQDIKNKLDMGDVVLIKGSHGSGMHKVVQGLVG